MGPLLINCLADGTKKESSIDVSNFSAIANGKNDRHFNVVESSSPPKIIWCRGSLRFVLLDYIQLCYFLLAGHVLLRRLQQGISDARKTK
jgi:hypothetical protein